MGARRYDIGDLYADLPEGWGIIDAAELPENAPLTLTAGLKGRGALQFSYATYESGEQPKASESDLFKFLMEFAAGNHVGACLKKWSGQGRLTFVAGDFQDQTGFVRAWYLTNGEDFVVATYTCDAPPDVGELSACDSIISSLDT